MGAGNNSATIAGYGATVVYGRDGNDDLTLNCGTALIDAGEGDDIMHMVSGSQFVVGGTGNDSILVANDGDVVAFNKGDGSDTLTSSKDSTAVLSLGGGIGYADLQFSRDELTLSTGEGDSITLSNWFAVGGAHGITTLQLVIADSDDDPNSSDVLSNRKTQTFDFRGLVSEFEQATSDSDQYTHWSLSHSLLSAHLSASNDAAIGGDLTYEYALSTSSPALQLSAIQAALTSAGFGRTPQQLTS